MQKRRFHSQNAGFEMPAPIGIGVKILAATDVSPSCRTPHTPSIALPEAVGQALPPSHQRPLLRVSDQ